MLALRQRYFIIRISPFATLSGRHLPHRTCLEEYIIRTVTRSSTCTICPENIDTIREEFIHVSGEFHLVRKDQGPEKRASQFSTDTVDVDEDELEFMRERSSRAKQYA